MHKKIFLIVLLFSLQSCATLSEKSIDTLDLPNYTSRLTLGIYVIQGNKKNLVVAYVPPERPISKSLRKGDIIETLNGRGVSSRLNLLEKTNKYSENEKVTLSVKRDKKHFEVKTELKRVIIRKDIDAIFQQLAREKDIHLAIIVDKLSNVFIQDHQELEEWKSAIKRELLASLENDYLHAFQYDPYFTLIDRDKVKEVLDELHFGLTGFVSHKEREQIGKFLGATHILFVQFSRLTSLGTLYRDVKSIQLIEIASDRVLTSLVILKE